MTASVICATSELQCHRTVTDIYEYDAFGNSFTVSGSTPNEMYYRGEQWDSDLGLYYFRARYYNPITGRFVSRDPDDGDLTKPASLHKYLYAGGDPINGWDPSGRTTRTAVAGGDAIDYGGLIITVLQAASGAIATQIAIDCAYNLLASETHAFVAVGLDGGGTVNRNSACSVKEDCDEERTKCLASGLASRWGRTFGNERCLECYDKCTQLGGWPTRTTRSTGGSIRCDYWNFPNKGDSDNLGVTPLPLGGLSEF
jgi:RHS repeat-associated protein